MAEILFYHLQGQRLEAALPLLLEKALEKGWNAVIRSGSAERLAVLDETLWSYREDSFLPHGREEEGDAEHQPILLTTGDCLANNPEVLFLVDRAPLPAQYPFERVVLMFDGDDPEAVDLARSAWKTVKALGHPATYWQQDNGRWVKKA
ncbi:DNA polymerase III subunit chi [Rhabdaerophilum sp. SD176]|uniref:DNA polymerase III subunit chi n=1 Tax=Rhabdaerophilum sp. SD176 TaxID=2983548 RepID=UPI0024DFFC21|nr:DNA polymerase III subunit chi [Rhabdaerophilum sp. SD176]